MNHGSRIESYGPKSEINSSFDHGILDAIRTNMLSPAVLFFALGLLAALTKSDLKFPEPLYVALTIYLLVAIGFKGGEAISEAGLAKVWLPALAAIALGAREPDVLSHRVTGHHVSLQYHSGHPDLV
jgi:hypothetical protein